VLTRGLKQVSLVTGNGDTRAVLRNEIGRPPALVTVEMSVEYRFKRHPVVIEYRRHASAPGVDQQAGAVTREQIDVAGIVDRNEVVRDAMDSAAARQVTADGHDGDDRLAFPVEWAVASRHPRRPENGALMSTTVARPPHGASAVRFRMGRDR
jgi:hypothetical protein